MAAENRLNLRLRNSHTVFCGTGDCRTIGIYEYTAQKTAASSPRFSPGGFFVQNLLIANDRLILRGFECSQP
jgi:hypothetical protein